MRDIRWALAVAGLLIAGSFGHQTEPGTRVGLDRLLRQRLAADSTQTVQAIVTARPEASLSQAAAQVASARHHRRLAMRKDHNVAGQHLDLRLPGDAGKAAPLRQDVVRDEMLGAWQDARCDFPRFHRKEAPGFSRFDGHEFVNSVRRITHASCAGGWHWAPEPANLRDRGVGFIRVLMLAFGYTPIDQGERLETRLSTIQ